MIITYKYRVKTNLGWLRAQSKKVNLVWNYCNETQKKSIHSGNKRISEFDLCNLTAGSSKILDLHAGTIQDIAKHYIRARNTNKKTRLRWRTKKSLGWLPFKGKYLKHNSNYFIHNNKKFKVFYSRPIPIEAKIKDDSNFSSDSRGRWYLNLVLEIKTAGRVSHEKRTAIGIDLGTKTFAALSNGRKIDSPKTLDKFSQKLAKAQRANKKRNVLKIYDKIKNSRKDFHHKLSNELVKNHNVIYVGNVNAKTLIKTRMAKSVFDAGWSSFRSMLAYKSIKNDVKYAEINENYSTQTCSMCEEIPASRPKGIADLGIREWVCCNCGAVHDRDINAAKNILRYGCVTPAVGALLKKSKDKHQRNLTDSVRFGRVKGDKTSTR